MSKGETPVGTLRESPETTAPAKGEAVPRRAPAPLAGRGALLVSLLALGVSVTQPLWREAVYGPVALPPSVAVKDVTPELSALRAEVAALRDFPPAVATAPDGASAVDLAPLEARLSRLEAGDVTGQMQHLRETVAGVEAAQSVLRHDMEARSGGDVADKTLLVAILQLVMAWQNGQPFGTPWQTVLSVVEATDPQLANLLREAAPMLLPLRDKGLPTLSALQAQFGDVARHVMQAAQPKGGAWWQQAWQNVQGLVSIRRVGDVGAADTSVEALLARAEGMLRDGNLSGVTALLGGLTDGPAAAAAKAWLAEAGARVEAEQLAQKMMSYVVSKLGPGSVPFNPAGGGADAPLLGAGGLKP